MRYRLIRLMEIGDFLYTSTRFGDQSEPSMFITLGLDDEGTSSFCSTNCFKPMSERRRRGHG